MDCGISFFCKIKDNKAALKLTYFFFLQLLHGSPFVTKELSQWVLVGVPQWPTIFICRDLLAFSRLSWYQDWIQEIITDMEPTIGTINSTGSEPTASTGTIGMTTVTKDDSIFSGGNNLIHFTQLFSLFALSLFLHFLVNGGEM